MTHTDVSIRRAKRTDHGGGFSEEAAFFGPGPQRLFGVLHRPTAPAMGGVVICPSIRAEFVTGYRTEVQLARALAARGLVVQRFHYRGEGHSDGTAGETTFATMREDALSAAERLLEETGVGGLAFLGTHFGGLLAASAASEHPECPLVLIEPTLEASRFFRDAWRAALIRDVKEGTAGRTPDPGLANALKREETVDVLGYEICRSLFESMTARTLVGELADGARRVLLVQLGRRASSLRTELEGTVTALRELGCRVDVEVVPEDDAGGWFLVGAEARHERPNALIEVTGAWLETEFAGGLG